MNDINNLFFELIQVSIGTRGCLSKTPTGEEWKALYDMAKKQSLVGVCFAGVQRLQQQRQEPPEKQYLTWMGMAAKIQRKNELMKAKGIEMVDRLKVMGCSACILKGQSLSDYYADLAPLRQSGDIDVWVKNRTVVELDAYVKGQGLKPHTTAAHVSYVDADGIEIELHAEPAFMRNFRTDRKLKRWSEKFNGSATEFNLVYMMVHMYHHVLFEGLGLRQLMDYYFCLKASRELPQINRELIVNTFSSFGMERFANGIMWIIAHVFANDNDSHNDNFFLGLKPSEKYGHLILEDVMTGGNFGHHDEKNKGLHSDSALGRSLNGLKRNMKFFALGPWEILSSPVWSTWHWWWRKRHGII